MDELQMWCAPDGLLQLDLAECAAQAGRALPMLPAAQLGALAAQLLDELEGQRAPSALIPAWHARSLTGASQQPAAGVGRCASLVSTAWCWPKRHGIDTQVIQAAKTHPLTVEQRKTR